MSIFVKKRNFIMLISLILTITLLLPIFSACSDKSDTKVKLRNVYSSESISLPENFQPQDSISYLNDRLYILGSMYDNINYTNSYAVYSVDTDGKNPITIGISNYDANTYAYVQNCYINPNGNISYTTISYAYDETTGVSSNTNILKTIDPEGNEILNIDLNEYFKDEDFYGIYNFAIDNNNNFYLLSNRTLIIADAAGKKLFDIKFEDNEYVNNFFIDSAGAVSVIINGYSSEKSSVKIKKIDVNNKKLGEALDLSSSAISNNTYNIVRSNDSKYDFYYSDQIGIYGHNLAAQKTDELLNYINSDIETTMGRNFAVISPEKIAYTTYDYETGKGVLMMLNKIPDDQIKEKYILTLAAFYLDYQIRIELIKFNKTNNEYRIQVNDYSQYNTAEDYRNGITVLNKDITAGKIPDILIIDYYNMPVESYNAKGLFADLYDFIDKDPEINIGDYFPNMLKAMDYNGKLYQIMTAFNIQTTVAKTSIVGDRTGWTMDEFNALMANQPSDVSAFDSFSWTRDQILNRYCVTLLDEFIDKDTGKCSFDSPGFIKVLEFANTLIKSEDISWDKYDDEYWRNRETAYRDNRILLSDYYFYNFEEYWRFAMGQFGEKISFIGMPTDSKNGSSMSFINEMSMAARTKHPQGVWEFMRTFIMDEYQSKLSWGVPIMISKVEKMALTAMTPLEQNNDGSPAVDRPMPAPAVSIARDVAAIAETEGTTDTEEKPEESIDYNGDGVIDEYDKRAAEKAAPASVEDYRQYYWIGNQRIFIGLITQEEVDRVMDFIKSVNRVSRNDEQVLSIINEEAAIYFAGDKTADETARVIQNRIQNYVNERR